MNAPMQDYGTIVVATDLSDPAVPAVRHGGALGRRLGSRLILVYVMEQRLPGFLSDPETRTIMKRHREHAERALAECVAEQLPGDEVETVVLEGLPHEQIVKLAEERQAGLIVVGMEGHGFLAHALTGSTAERVLHHAPCPVLVCSQSH